MSFDLAVFSPDAAPREQGAFMAWFKEQVKWEGPKDYGDPASLNSDLFAFYSAMVEEFPAMNGPLAKPFSDEDDDPRTTDYCGIDGILYMGFRWDVASDAYDSVTKIARATGVGFFDVSDGEAEPEFPGSQVPSETAPPKKRGFLGRLFGR